MWGMLGVAGQNTSIRASEPVKHHPPLVVKAWRHRPLPGCADTAVRATWCQTPGSNVARPPQELWYWAMPGKAAKASENAARRLMENITSFPDRLAAGRRGDAGEIAAALALAAKPLGGRWHPQGIDHPRQAGNAGQMHRLAAGTAPAEVPAARIERQQRVPQVQEPQHLPGAEPPRLPLAAEHPAHGRPRDLKLPRDPNLRPALRFQVPDLKGCRFRNHLRTSA